MNLSERALRFTLLNLGGLAIQFGGGLVVSIVIARSLGPEQLGLFQYAVWPSFALLALFSPSFAATTMRYVAHYRAAGKNEVAAAVARRVVQWQAAAAVTLAAVAISSVWIFAQRPSRAVLAVGFCMLLPLTLREAGYSLIAGCQLFLHQPWITAASSGVQIGAVVFAASGHASPVTLLAAYMSGIACYGLLSFAVAGRVLFRGVASVALAPEMKRELVSAYRANLGISVISAVLWERSDVVPLKWFASEAQVAFYSVPFTIWEFCKAMAATFTSIALPLTAERLATPANTSDSIFRRGVVYVWVVTLPLAAALGLLATPLLRLAYGEPYISAAPVLQALIASLPAGAVAMFMVSMATAAGKQQRLVRLWAPIAALNVVAAMLAAQHGGAFGAGAVKAALQFGAGIVALIAVAKQFRSPVPWRQMGRAAMACACAFTPLAIATAMGAGLNTRIACAAGALGLYAVILWQMRTIGGQELQLLRNLLGGPAAKVNAPGEPIY